MKAEVNKTVEVVVLLQLTEAEAKCLREMMRCIFVGDREIHRNSNSVQAEDLIDGMDTLLFHLLDNTFYSEGIG